MGADVAADASADVADDVSFDPTRDPTRPTWILTRPGQQSDPTRSTVRPDPVNSQTRPGQRSDPTRSTVRPDPVNGQTRPGQRSDPTRSMVNRVNGQTRPGQHNPDPVARAAMRCHTRRTFWLRVRARERVILGNFGTYRFVSKFPTMWYIDLACLKLLQI